MGWKHRFGGFFTPAQKDKSETERLESKIKGAALPGTGAPGDIITILPSQCNKQFHIDIPCCN